MSDIDSNEAGSDITMTDEYAESDADHRLAPHEHGDHSECNVGECPHATPEARLVRTAAEVNELRAVVRELAHEYLTDTEFRVLVENRPIIEGD